MVKAIKKRVPKEVQSDESDIILLPESASSETTPKGSSGPSSASDRFRAEVTTSASSGGDRFSEAVEGFLLSLADNWVALLLLAGVSVGVYGFVRYNEKATERGFAEGRSALESTLDGYKTLQYQAVRAAKSSSAAAEASPLGVSLAPTTTVEGPKGESYIKAAEQFKALKLSERSAPLAQLGEASARFDAAQNAEEFAQAAELFTKVGANPSVERIAQGVALRNAAIAYEEAAKFEGESQKAYWAKAATAWNDFSEANKEVFGLVGQINRARVLRLSGDIKGAHDAYLALQRSYNAALQEPKNRALKSEVKLGLALTGGQGTSQATSEQSTEAK